MSLAETYRNGMVPMCATWHMAYVHSPELPMPPYSNEKHHWLASYASLAYNIEIFATEVMQCFIIGVGEWGWDEW